MNRRPFASRLAAPLLRRPRLVLGVTVLVTVLALVPALRFRVDTDLSALLPEGAPGAEDYRLFLQTFGGFEKVFIIVRSPEALEDPGPLLDAAERLAGILAESPEVADARSGITAEDEAFFLEQVAPRLPLLVEDPARELAPRLTPEAVRQRVAEMRQTLRSPVGGVAAPLFAGDPLGLSEGMLDAATASFPVEPLSGSFLSPDGQAALVVLTPARAEIDPAGGRALMAGLDRAYARVREESGLPLEIDAVGGPLYAAQDEALLRQDLTRTATGSAAGVAILLLVGFAGGYIPLVILLSVLAGLVWTVAATALSLGSITVVGIGFAAALIGVGVEYGIHGGARFRELRRRGDSREAALDGTFRNPGPGIFSSALTTAAGLAPLCLAHFRPLREVGWVLTIGVLVILVTTATLGAALMLLDPRKDRPRPPSWLWRRWGQPALDGTVGFAARHPWPVLAALLALTALSAWGLTRLGFSADLRSLRPADHPSLRAERLLVESFSLGLDTFTVVTRAPTLGEALDGADESKRVLEERLGAEAQVTAPSDWLIQGERLERRLRELRELPLERAAGDLERELAAAGFRLEPFAPALAALRAMGRGEDPGAPPPAEWPRWMSELIRMKEKDGAAVAVHVRIPLGWSASEGQWDALARELREAVPSSTRVALASVPRLGSELRDLAVGDLSRSAGLALLLVTIVVLVSVRGRIGDALLSGLPLALGCLWTFGLWGVFRLPVDLLAVSTLPVLFGTGIDLGVHAVQGGRLRPAEGIGGTLRESGLAMLLVALTTGTGFGSLGASRVPGLQNAGTLVAVGVIACLAATFLVLPAVEALRRPHPPAPSPASPVSFPLPSPSPGEGEADGDSSI